MSGFQVGNWNSFHPRFTFGSSKRFPLSSPAPIQILESLLKTQSLEVIWCYFQSIKLVFFVTYCHIVFSHFFAIIIQLHLISSNVLVLTLSLNLIFHWQIILLMLCVSNSYIFSAKNNPDEMTQLVVCENGKSLFINLRSMNFLKKIRSSSLWS